MKNREIAEIFYEIADFLEMQDVQYKPRAYRKAARNIEALSEDIREVYERDELEGIQGVGESLAGKIAEYLETGDIDYYRELKEAVPVDIEALTAVEGLGPKRVRKLYQELGITDLDGLEEAAEAGEIAAVEGFGETSQQKILDHIELARRGQERSLLGEIFPLARSMEERLSEEPAFDRVQIVGSFRRRLPTVGDIDILATAGDHTEAMEVFCSLDEVKEVLARGETKASVFIEGDLRVDLRIVGAESYGSALLYFTGSKDHNVSMRTVAMDRGWKLSEYGLFDGENSRLEGRMEAEVFEAMEMQYIPPELREDRGEIAAAQESRLPELVEGEEIRGDLQVHTTYSDGSDSVLAMAEKAEELGYEYLLITDHGPSLQIAGGLDEGEIAEQREGIKAADEQTDVMVLHGIEANIQKDGTLDVQAELLEEMDLVVCALHNRYDDPTGLMVSVMQEYPVDILAHPTNRRIHEREPMDLDMDRIAEVAAAERVALEINAQPRRLDLDWKQVMEYRDQVKYVVSTDAHGTGEMDFMHLGVAQARKGWCTAGDILNTRSLDELRSFFG